MCWWHSAPSTGRICAVRGLWRNFRRRWNGRLRCASRLRGRARTTGAEARIVVEILRGAEAPLFHVTARRSGAFSCRAETARHPRARGRGRPRHTAILGCATLLGAAASYSHAVEGAVDEEEGNQEEH